MVPVEPVWTAFLGDLVLLMPALTANPFTAVQTVLLSALTGAAMFGGG